MGNSEVDLDILLQDFVVESRIQFNLSVMAVFSGPEASKQPQTITL